MTDSTGTSTYRYNAVGSKVSETKPNGVNTQYNFNAKNQLTSMEHSKDNQVIARYAYMLDPMGKRTQLIEETFSDVPTTTTSVWQYDDLNRLISETIHSQTTTHNYDAVSNRIKQTKDGQVTTYSYDNNDRLTQETGARTASYTYDKQGNTLAQNVNGQMTNYSYNVRNELVQTDDVNFGYDIDGIRNSKAKNGVTIDYITDKNRDYAQVILEKQNSTPVASYSYGDDLISQNVNGMTSYFGYDGLGSTKFLTSQAGQITDSYQYDAYGEIINKAGNTDNIYLYTGEQFDRSLNQYYLRARYYNQGVGRLTQMDSWQGTASNPTTLNKYLYANANPTYYTDPSGHFGLASFSVSQQMMGMLAVSSLPIAYVIGQELAANNTVGGSYTPVQLGWLTIAGMAGAGTEIYERITEKLEERNDQLITLSRSVEDVELASMYSCKCYSLGPNMFPKQFFHTDPEAMRFGYEFIWRFAPRFHLTNTKISQTLYITMDHQASEAGIGSIVTVPNNLLPAFNLEMNKNGGFKYRGTYERNQ